MDDIILQHPIHTLNKKELLPRDTLFTAKALDSVLSMNTSKNLRTVHFLSYSTIEADMRRLLDAPPYRVIFNKKEVEETMKHIADTELIEPVMDAMDYFKENDYYTYRHFLVVFALTTLLAGDLISDDEERADVFASGPSHDIGKICVPLPILKKIQPLTRKEHAIMRQHTVAGYTLLSYYLGNPEHLTARVAFNHHERKDGTGYPRKIPDLEFLTEIIAVSDIYDALISRRPYRPVSFDNRTALEQIIDLAINGQIGWRVVKALIARNRSKRPEGSNFEIPKTKRGKPPVNNVYGLVAEDLE